MSETTLTIQHHRPGCEGPCYGCRDLSSRHPGAATTGDTMNETPENTCRVVAVGSCNVSPELASQFRNGPHWHTVWPDGQHWCYPTEAEAAERAAELSRLPVPQPQETP